MLKNLFNILVILFALSQLLGHFKKHNNYNITIINPIYYDCFMFRNTHISGITRDLLLSDKS